VSHARLATVNEPIATLKTSQAREDRMAGSTAGIPLDGLTDGLRSRLAEASLPATADVEIELRRLARQRLGPTTEGDTASRSHRSSRSLRHQRDPLVGAFDSPAGFAFGSDGSNHKR
jgi:hypothetical protein